ncbi:MAG: IS4 family transposase [Bacteroidota bacterium]|nr:IS4 family transposase [Bacteroidota bacterium]
MYSGATVFSQVMAQIKRYEFDQLVAKYHGNYKVRSFSSWDQFLSMSFAQLSYRRSLRDIEACLNAQPNKLYHMGIRGNVARSNLARANENRDWRIYSDLAQKLIPKARKLYHDDSDFALDLENTVYALDSTTIDLCLTLFPWAQFRKYKSAVKLHTLLDLRGSIPTFIDITSGAIHDVNVLDVLIPEAGSFYVMDKGYIDYERLYQLHKMNAFFVTRAKSNLSYRRLYSQAIDKQTGLRSDQIIRLTGLKSSLRYPEKLRRVRYYDRNLERYFVFLTNNMEISAQTVADLYHERWKIELFFKWVKQHLRIKAFYGTSANAVKTQVWIAVCAYLLVAIVKKKIKTELSLYTILQILSVSLFEKVSINQLLTESESHFTGEPSCNQLNLWDL